MQFIYNKPTTKDFRRSLRHNQTDAERKIWNMVRQGQIEGLKFFRQYGVGSYVLDFYCPQKRIAIEVDGGQHAGEKQRLHDEKRTLFLAQHDIHVLRFWDNEVLLNIEGVWQKIQEAVKST